MKKRKLKFNSEAQPNTADSYIREPSVVEGEKGYQRLAFRAYPRAYKDGSGKVTKSLIIDSDNRSIEFYLNEDSSVEFDEKSGTAEFTANGKQYKIRALQEDDKSWIINFRLPSEEENS